MRATRKDSTSTERNLSVSRSALKGASSASRRRPLSALWLLAGATILTPGCAHEFDTERTLPVRGSVGEEMFGVICDRVGAQALREDLTGASFRSICHRAQGSEFADKVDTSQLPAIHPDAKDEKNQLVSVEKQTRDRNKAVGRIESLARRRAELIRAFDTTFPEEKVSIKDLDNPDETKSCGTPAGSSQDSLAGQVADMFGRMTDLYNDGTIPQSTQSLARLVDTFQKSDEAQGAWARLSARQGYRPIETALGVARPVVAYPGLRDLSNTTLRLVSADSEPYQLNPQKDEHGNRIPVAGPGNVIFNKMLEAAHFEFLNAKADPRVPNLVVSTDARTGRPVVSRPRDNLEILQELFYKTDDAFGGGAPHYIVRRDTRGYASLTNGLPSGFLDEDRDGLPDVDGVGRYRMTGGAVAPSPFPFSGTVDGTVRDEIGRALVDGKLLYDYIDTNQTFASHLLDDLKPLFNPDPTAKHETIMDLAGGLYVGLGQHVKATKSYANGKVDYDGISPDAALLELLYAGGIVLGDKNADTTLAMASDLLTNHQPELARLVGTLLEAQETAKRHDEAKIPKDATFWDDALEITGKIAEQPELLKDILLALSDPATAKLGEVLAKNMAMKDHVTYDREDINGPLWNATTNDHGDLTTSVDRGAPITGWNRSAFERVLMLLSDSKGVTICNKEGALLHAKKSLLGIETDITLPSLSLKLLGIPITIFPGRSYRECGVIKIDDLAVFYIDTVADASHVRVNDPRDKIPPGTLYLRNTNLRNGDLFLALPDWVPSIFKDPLRSIGKPTVGLMSHSSGIEGFWEPAESSILAPKPEWLSRFSHFDIHEDTVNGQTGKMVEGLTGDVLPTAICREEIIDDPEGGQIDASPDKKVHVRRCEKGQSYNERNPDTLFLLEKAGFFDAIRPIIRAFVKHKAEDLFLDIAKVAYKYYPNKDANSVECALPEGKNCTRAGMNSYEPLAAEQLIGDVVPALNALLQTLSTMEVTKCEGQLPNGLCASGKTKTITGLDVIVDATKTLVDPVYAKDTLKLKDRHGNAATKKNDGSPVAQTTPAYIITNALNAVDAAFDAYEAEHPDDKERRANYRRGRSQLVDQFLSVEGSKTDAKFRNPTLPKLAPMIVDILRAQLNARCPKSFTPPFEKCTWASEELAKKATDTLTGPLVSTGLDLLEIIRRDPDARVQAEHLIQYLLDPGSNNDARASVLASASDLLQVLRDEENLTPLYHLMAAAVDASVKDANGRVEQKSLIDAQMALLAKLSGRYFDANNKEICKREVDPNQVLTKALAKLVTPINDKEFKGQSPLEVILDVVADVNRVDPTQPYSGTLEKSDYGNVSENVVDFLTNRERGLEQFYEVIRQGTKF